MRLNLLGQRYGLWRTGLLVLCLLVPFQVLAEPLLENMTKQESPSQTRISLGLSELPVFKVTPTGQRIDIVLKETTSSDTLRQLPEDETIVNITLAEKSGELIVSILLRQPPRQVTTASQEDPARLNLDVFWQESDAIRPGVAFSIAGMPPRKAGRRASAYQKRSAWEDDWKRFFADYHQDWQVELPLSFTFPELPALINDDQSPIMPLQQFATDGLYLSLLRTSTQLTNLTEEQSFQRDVLVAEAQLRSDGLAAGLARLEAMRRERQSKSARVEYLTAYAQALDGQPIVGQLTLAPMLEQMPDDDPLLPYYHLLYAETDLAAKRDKDAAAYLAAENLSWPKELAEIVALRRADSLAGSKVVEQATAAYKVLDKSPGLLQQHIFSMNRAAVSAFQNQDYAFSADLYRRLITVIEEQELALEGYDLILYAAGVAAYEAGNLAWGKIGLEKALYDDESTEGAQRARLRLVDIQVIQGGELELGRAIAEYDDMAQHATYRTVREESAFKQALGHYLLGDHRLSVEELMTFQRDYYSSALRRDAEVLLARQIPLVVHQLIEENNDLGAVVLVEKNRKILLSSGFDRQFLEDLASAFGRLGLYERSARVLLYLLDRIDEPAEKANIYLPLITSYLKRGEYALVSQHAERYMNDYPNGEDADTIFALLLDAFEKQKQNDKIEDWLSRRNRPTSAPLEVRAAWIYWHLGKQEAALESLKKAQQEGGTLEVKEMALLGELSFKQNDLATAKTAYETLKDDKEYAPQARYRLAQMLIKQKENKKASELIKGLAKEYAESTWTKLAQDLLNDM